MKSQIQMRDYKAVRPDKFFSSLASIMRDEEAKKKGITEEERALATLSETLGWKILSEYIDYLIDDLDNVNDQAIANGATFEEIGRNTLVVSLAKGVIKRIKDKVADAKEACEGKQEGME